jgi:hypothetical protein
LLKLTLVVLRLTLGAVPVPLNPTTCGLPPALSLNERVPEALPTAVGVKVSATVQDPDAATGAEIEQVVPEAAIAKGPVTPIAVKVRLALPALVTVTLCAGLVVPTGSDGKVGADDKLTMAPNPMALKALPLGLFQALSVNIRLPEAVPTAVGVKVTATLQVPAAATGLEVEHVVPEVAMAKGPVVVIALKVRLALPVLVTVTVCAGLVVPTGSEGKVGTVKLIMAPVPVPLKSTL